jgi:hypothetical protein
LTWGRKEGRRGRQEYGKNRKKMKRNGEERGQRGWADKTMTTMENREPQEPRRREDEKRWRWEVRLVNDVHGGRETLVHTYLIVRC